VWRWVHSVLGDDAFVAPVDRDRYTIAFEANGILKVRADCNQVSGTYRQLGRRLTVQLGPSTRAACPPGSRDDEFLAQLGAVVSQASTETTLVLNLRQDSGSMIFEPQPPLSLIGSSWLVHSYNNGRGAVITPLPDTRVTAEFGDDATISGSSGCNTYSGTYSVDGTSLSIGPLATTRLACDEPVMEQEQAYLEALQAATQFELTTERLTLRNDEDATQVDYLPAPFE
jgi:heat shock protein HslJ